MGNSDQIRTEEYFIASIDLLGVKEIIKQDSEDQKLNQIRDIYRSWPRILEDGYFQDMQIRFFSDNVVIALQASKLGAADKLLETIGWICSHFLICGYKPRGGICKGKFYMDDIFVWGAGLVDAYLIESKSAIYPRIVVTKEVANASTKHLSEWMLFEDADGKVCLNYLKAFGGSKDGWIKDINSILEWLLPEYIEIQKHVQDERCSKEDRIIFDKIEWLVKFVKENKTFWENIKK